MRHERLFFAVLLAAACTTEPTPEDMIVAPEGGENVQPPPPGPGEEVAEIGECSGMDFPLGCLANCAQPVPDGAKCQCSILDCEATQIECQCDLECYTDPEGCAFGPDGEVLDPDLADRLGECASEITCEEEGDLSEHMTCGAQDCPLVNPDVVVVAPVSPEVSPNAPSVTPSPPSAPSSEMANRQPTEVDVLFVVDNSASMGDDQLAAACAIDSFFGAVDAGGGIFQAGVLTTDVLGDSPIQPPNLNATPPCRQVGSGIVCDRAPGLIGLQGSCGTTFSCQCPASTTPDVQCKFDDQGGWIDSTDAAGRNLLRQLIVQGERGSWHENGLEAAFQYFIGQERQGLFDPARPVEVVVITDEDANADDWMCPFSVVSRNLSGISGFTPPQPSNTMASCKQDMIAFYGEYFASRNIIVHGLTFGSGCNAQNTEEIGTVYQGVIARTGGQTTSICQCGTFDTFFTAVGETTARLSTSICLDNVPDPSTIEVTYTDGATSQTVPPGAGNGWTYDPARNCIDFNGSWATAFGSYRVDYLDPNATTDAVECVPPATPVSDPVTLSCNGEVVPQNTSNGYTFDRTSGCFTFYGDWAQSGCTFDLNPTACGLVGDDPMLTEYFCDGAPIPNHDGDGYSTVPGRTDCIGLHGSFEDAGCSVSQTPRLCFEGSDPPPVSGSLELLCNDELVPESTANGAVLHEPSLCFYVYGSWATRGCGFSISYLPAN